MSCLCRNGDIGVAVQLVYLSVIFVYFCVRRVYVKRKDDMTFIAVMSVCVPF